MVKLLADETRLRGSWRLVGDKVCADEISERIDELVTTHLKRLGTDETGWDTLYQDPNDSRLWELIYPQSESHGGGPAELRVIDPAEARLKYGYF